MKLSPHVTLSEVIKSQQATRLGIDNHPNQAHMMALQNICNDVFEKVRNHFGVPIAITSGYRSPTLNRAIGGSTTSQHCKGEAIDIDADVFGGDISNREIFEFIEDNCTFDQLIWEFGDDQNPDWVHVSYKKEGPNRGQTLKAVKSGRNVTYQPL